MGGDCVFISAKEQINIEELKRRVYDAAREVHLSRFPYNDFLYQTYSADDDATDGSEAAD